MKFKTYTRISLFYTFVYCLIFLISVKVEAQNHSLTYYEAFAAYRKIDNDFEDARMFTYGKTDCGEPLNLLVISTSGLFDPALIHAGGKCVVFINNGIHPGEPDGIDASVMFLNQILSDSSYRKQLDNVVLCVIPVFNIDGALERGCCSRANQDGPDEYGFRGNAKNLDLNRDFVKADARNTKSLINILRKWDPDVMIDTHVSDGADYQYTMTLVNGQHSKLSKPVDDFMEKTFLPSLYSSMEKKGDPMINYVNIYPGYDGVPDSGIFEFMETPRYLNGYQSLYDCFTFTIETHMLKPYPKRVQSTLRLLHTFLEVCSEKSESIVDARNLGREEKYPRYYYNWKLDTTRSVPLKFKGYEAEYIDSKVTTGKRLHYNRNKPYEKDIPFYKYYIPADTIVTPKYFYVPQSFEELVSKLEQNGVTAHRIATDSNAMVTTLFIDDYKTVERPYEGHYLHYDVKYRTEQQRIRVRKGDYLVPMPQTNMRYAMETLLPDAVDSYFCWGFFDSFLMQKEWFSDYIFEDIAEELLKKDAQLKKEYLEWQKGNPKASKYEQLGFIYKRSKYYEKNFMRYPVGLLY